MTQAAQPTGSPQGRADHSTASQPPSGGDWVSGGVMFAAVLMLCSGVLAVLQGIAAVAEDDVYARIGTYVYELNLTGWGVVHIVIGALAVITGIGLFQQQTWARYAGIFLASLSLVAQFLFLPYAPVWAVIMMAIDVFVIWALASWQEAAI
ncbi:hypothetical protein JS756_23280 [Streptomyces actuosus]|uniref:DUF7144 domain-containing protein n=1 Tax=Streptomyces actuosus TaxID=1885 RepID=A0ABS2VVD1_STRAS|nr:hypothetical protein [Streptomyces actuosus]MBN0046985.1 hypothetical protein [Streptomyces actuosus]